MKIYIIFTRYIENNISQINKYQSIWIRSNPSSVIMNIVLILSIL